MFEIQKSGDKTSSGEIGLNIRTHASPKVGQDQVSGGVSVPFRHATPVADALWKPITHLYFFTFSDFSVSDMGYMNDIWGFLRLAFATGFEDGEIKSVKQSICNHIIKQMESVRLLVESPPPNSLLVSCVMPAVEYELVEEMPSLDLDTCPVTSEKKDGVVVPDEVVYHPTLPLFLLSVECTRACDNDNHGIVRCLHQMLSHMHHQDPILVSGLVHTPGGRWWFIRTKMTIQFL